MKSEKITPLLPKGSVIEVIAYVYTEGYSKSTTKRAMHFANALETHVMGGVETFTGWCNFLEDGTRVGALAKNEKVTAWETPTRSGIVEWVKFPIKPEVPKGEIRQLLISFQRFGEQKPTTRVAYFANEYRDERATTNRGVQTYSGWMVGHTAFGVQCFVTIGDAIIAWAEFPECDIEE